MAKKIPQKPTHRKRSPFYWWRRFPTHKGLHHYKPLIERIKNGDFDPSLAGAGVHTLLYYYQDSNSCDIVDSLKATVYSLPSVTAANDTSICEHFTTNLKISYKT